MENSRSRAAVTQELALWISGALFTLACFGFLVLFRGEFDPVGLELQSSRALLFGLFHQSVAHSVVHLLLAIGILLSAASLRGCRSLLLITGASMIALAVYGQLSDTPALRQLVPTSEPDAWLHLVLGAAMLGATAAPWTRVLQAD